MLLVRQFPCLSDNYGFLVHDENTGATATIDTPDPDVILDEAAAAGWRITDIWNTHWHADHAGGNAAIIRKTGARVTGPSEVARAGEPPHRIVEGGEVIELGASTACVLPLGGHTLGHVGYLFDDEGVAFVGDTLFSLGCGRLFEGTPAQMWTSLQTIAALPARTRLYCAHEYTAANARFALSIEPDNQALVRRAGEVERLRDAGLPTVPTTVAEELAANPFLRASILKDSLGAGDDVSAFAELRRRKDSFRG